jgi:hypothetical protein
VEKKGEDSSLTFQIFLEPSFLSRLFSRERLMRKKPRGAERKQKGTFSEISKMKNDKI